MKTLFQVDVDDQRKQLILRVGREMGIAQHRGYVLFDDSDYRDYPNPKWRGRALHFNVHRDGVEEISPEHILQLMNSPNCDHFVWLSKQIAESEPTHMAWVYAHELRHVIQDTLYPGLSEMTISLRKLLRGENVQLGTDYQVELPQELDAELAARRLVLQVLGEENYRTYRRGQCAIHPAAIDYFRRFGELASNWGGDPIVESKRLLALFDKGQF